MPNGTAPPGEVEQVTGLPRQLGPDEEQFVDGELQTLTRAPAPVIEIAEPDHRIGPLPATAIPGAQPGIAIPGVAPGVPGVIVDLPILVLNRLITASADWQDLVRWDIPPGFSGDLHEISLLSNDDAHTRYQVVISNIDMQVPTDRSTSTPVTLPWRNTKVPGGTSVYVRIRNTDAVATITVDAAITGTVRAA